MVMEDDGTGGKGGENSPMKRLNEDELANKRP
jgi:hypothetical protein